MFISKLRFPKKVSIVTILKLSWDFILTWLDFFAGPRHSSNVRAPLYSFLGWGLVQADDFDGAARLDGHPCLAVDDGRRAHFGDGYFLAHRGLQRAKLRMKSNDTLLNG